MREAFHLSKVHSQRDLRRPTVDDLFGRDKARLVELCDALAVEAIEQNKDVTTNPLSLGALWAKLSHPRPVNADQGGNHRRTFSRRCWPHPYG